MLSQAEQQTSAQKSGARRPQHRQAAQPAGEHSESVGARPLRAQAEQKLGCEQSAVLTCSVRNGPVAWGPKFIVITSEKVFALKADRQWKAVVTMRP